MGSKQLPALSVFLSLWDFETLCIILSPFGLSVLRFAYDLLLIPQAVCLSLRKDGGGRGSTEEMESIL